MVFGKVVKSGKTHLATKEKTLVVSTQTQERHARWELESNKKKRLIGRFECLLQPLSYYWHTYCDLINFTGVQNQMRFTDLRRKVQGDLVSNTSTHVTPFAASASKGPSNCNALVGENTERTNFLHYLRLMQCTKKIPHNPKFLKKSQVGAE